MEIETITDRPDLLIRRMTLEPGQASPWHTDTCHRFSVVVRGDELTIEHRNVTNNIIVSVQPGGAGWDQPTARPHRAVNTGTVTYEEVVTFFRDPPGTEPQPEAH